jgi:hypothetical protein
METRANWEALHPELFCCSCGSKIVDEEGNSLRTTEAVRKVVTLREYDDQYALNITWQTRAEYDAEENV